MFGSSFGYPEVLSPNIDKHFTNGGGSAIQHSYVQIAVCGPSRASILTGRRPDTTTVGVSAGIGRRGLPGWCWCQRGNCKENELFMTLPTFFAQNGFVTTGTGKIFHPDACTTMRGPFHSFGKEFAHRVGDDHRAWNSGAYGNEGRLKAPFDGFIDQFSEEQYGTIPGPKTATFNHTQGPVWMKSPLSDEEQTDGQLATDAINRLANFSAAGIGKGSSKPFFLATGFHKPHTPWIVPEKYFDMYDLDRISLPPNPRVPTGFKEENWHANGNVEIKKYFSAWPNPDGSGTKPFDEGVFSFDNPVNNKTARELRLAYFAATTFIDAQIGRVMDALEAHGYKDNTVVALWSDHGYHLGDTNSWCKMTNFEKATRNTLLWRVPGQVTASQGRNNRYVEMLDFFPTAIDLMGLPKIATCAGLDQPPTVACLQGQSYADEFTGKVAAGEAKQHIFSQWPYSVQNSPGVAFNRMGYTVRSADGYRLTRYVPYDGTTYRGNWSDAVQDDMELYDYNKDPDETTNQAANPAYADIVRKLGAVLKTQYT